MNRRSYLGALATAVPILASDSVTAVDEPDQFDREAADLDITREEAVCGEAYNEHVHAARKHLIGTDVDPETAAAELEAALQLLEEEI
ncbi:hypothetical protein GWK26_08685 [haloarchaeon 3A1-DGR]|nr:hypothetical protein GWK26_08685 [haloarchaeon 3A1-DGR]